jgi:hypothetical protein
MKRRLQSMRSFALLGLLLAALEVGATPQEDPDLNALNLADKAIATTEQASDWHTLLEAAYGDTYQRYDLPSVWNERLSLDVALDKTLGGGWRLIFADRLDWDWQDQSPDDYKINTLKEAYLSWQLTPSDIVDFGRINTRYGVATGYNPTDYFREDAVRSVVSINPSSLRNNRLGSVMLRSQFLWDGGGLTALISPKITDTPSNEAFNPDFGATNNTNRWLLALSQQLSEGLNPQFLLYGKAGQTPQVGVDLTYLIGDATVAFLEWSGGNDISLYAQALGGAPRDVFRNRLAGGLTYTASNKLSLTAEAEYNGAALDSEGWATLGSGPLPRYEQYRNVAQALQDLPTRTALFMYASWPDAWITHLDLTALTRQDMIDHSRLAWGEVRYHWDHTDLAVQWQRDGGRPWSDFGVLPQRTAWQTVLTYYF